MNTIKNFTTYKSSAGSGKTYTLVKEFLKLVFLSDSPTRYRNILAITFTNKAANEMKERVLDNLRELSKKEDNKLLLDYEKDFGLDKIIIREKAKLILQSILHNYSDLKISTIDKFTHKIIRAFSKDLNLTTDFDIEMDKDKILLEAIELIISRAGEDEKISTLLIDFLNSQIDNEKDWKIEKSIFEFSKELTNEENELFLEILKTIPEEEFSPIQKNLLKEISSLKEKITKSSKEVIGLFEQNGLKEEDFSSGTIYKFFKNIEKGLFDKLLDPNVTLWKGINENKWLPAKASSQAISAMEGISEEVRSLFYDIETCSKQYFLFELIYENIFNLVLIKELHLAIETIKEEQNLLLISDFNKLISKEIKNQPAPFIYEKIGERYKNIMIDEFQDTSVLQWHNLLPLIDNSLSIGEKTLLVGDAKQAIYRFRGGKVEQFVELPNLIDKSDDIFLEEREIALRNNHTNEFLNTNYRSHSQVIEFNNWFFEGLKPFLSESKQKIYDKQKQETTDKKEGLVQVTFLHYDKDEIDELYLQSTKDNIDECLADGFRLKDIAILVDKNKRGKLLSNFLVKNNYNVVTSESLLIEEDKTVNFLINFLKYIQNNKNNKSKLEIIKYFFEKEKFNPALLKYAQKHKNKATINIKELLNEINSQFSLNKLYELSLYDLAETIVREFVRDKKVMNTFLMKLLDVIYSFSIKNNDLLEFLNFWSNNSYKISLETPENDAVTIMSVHKSKGLQFPVVISSFTNWEFHMRGKTTNKWVSLQGIIPNLPVGIIPLKKSITKTDFSFLKEIEDENVQLDKFNMLYVAFTRAEKRLYIISDDNVKTGKKYKENIMSSYLRQLCSTHEKFENNFLQIGERVQEKKKEEKQTDNYALASFESTNWRNKIRISKQYQELWGEDNYQTKIAYGNLIHNILAKVETSEDIRDAVLDFTNQGLIDNSEVDEFITEINEIISIPEVEPWFSGRGKVMNEKEIISKTGELYRPDKVVSFSSKTIVVDFKTGEKQQNHSKQLNNYANLLEEMNYQNVEKYILYTKIKELIKI